MPGLYGDGVLVCGGILVRRFMALAGTLAAFADLGSLDAIFD
jgi:hypothetical protein